MANRYPLIVDTSDDNKIKEIPSGDALNLTGNTITGVGNVTSTGTISATTINATNIQKGGTDLANVATSGSFNDLVNRPTQLSDLTDDLNVLVPGDNVGQLTNNVGYLTTVAFADLTGKPTTIAGYGITDAATTAQGALADTALQPGANISTLTNDSNFVTLTQLTDGSITVDVNNSGDLVGSVFADDSTVMIDSILASVNLNGTVRDAIVANDDDLHDIGTTSVRFKDAHFSGTVNGSFAGTLTGDVSGSVFSDDSTQVIDGVAGTVTSAGFVQFGSYTTTERNALTAVNGMVVYNSTDNKFQGYANGAWVDLRIKQWQYKQLT